MVHVHVCLMCVLVAVAILEEWHLQICDGCFNQVSKGPLLVYSDKEGLAFFF